MRRLTENVTQFGNRHFNYFLVGQHETAVIECGVSGGVSSFKSQWEPMQNKPDVKYLFAMHAHFDHVCGIPALKELFPETLLLGSETAGKVLNKLKIVGDFFCQDKKMSQLLVDEGILEVLPRDYSVDTIALDGVIGEGDEIKLSGGLKIKVLGAPGHSPCSLACYLSQEQFMFLSDAAGFQISDQEIFPVFFQGYEIYLETIKRLMSFPTRILGIPHEKVWTGNYINEFYQRALASAREIYDDITRMLEEGWDDEKIRQSLFPKYYQGNLKIYTTQNITTCMDILLRRVKECL